MKSTVTAVPAGPEALGAQYGVAVSVCGPNRAFPSSIATAIVAAIFVPQVRRSMTRSLTILLIVAIASSASAQDHGQDRDLRQARDEESGDHRETDTGWSYLVDGGALPFFWGSAVVALGASTLLSPPESPRLFSPDEGGREPAGSTVPTYQVGILAGLTPLLIGFSGGDARLYHAKGAAEAIVTVAALTEVTKSFVGRHRPIYDGASSHADHRRSFFSWHSSMTLASTTYAGLYLHGHVFAEWREPDQKVAWWELPPLATLAAISVYVPYSRVADGRHHKSDVLVGAGIGSVTAIGFYVYQEGRFDVASSKRESRRYTVTPTSNGVSVGGRW